MLVLEYDVLGNCVLALAPIHPGRLPAGSDCFLHESGRVGAGAEQEWAQQGQTVSDLARRGHIAPGGAREMQALRR